MIKKRPKGFRSSKKKAQKHRKGQTISIVNNGILWYFGCKEHGFTTSLLTTGDVMVPGALKNADVSSDAGSARKVRDE